MVTPLKSAVKPTPKLIRDATKIRVDTYQQNFFTAKIYRDKALVHVVSAKTLRKVHEEVDDFLKTILRKTAGLDITYTPLEIREPMPDIVLDVDS